MTTKTIFSVRCANGTHTTQTVHGQRASSTCSHEDAARRLADKLHPLQACTLTLLDSSPQGVKVFELEPAE